MAAFVGIFLMIAAFFLWINRDTKIGDPPSGQEWTFEHTYRFNGIMSDVIFDSPSAKAFGVLVDYGEYGWIKCMTQAGNRLDDVCNDWDDIEWYTIDLAARTWERDRDGSLSDKMGKVIWNTHKQK